MCVSTNQVAKERNFIYDTARLLKWEDCDCEWKKWKGYSGIEYSMGESWNLIKANITQKVSNVLSANFYSTQHDQLKICSWSMKKFVSCAFQWKNSEVKEFFLR